MILKTFLPNIVTITSPVTRIAFLCVDSGEQGRNDEKSSHSKIKILNFFEWEGTRMFEEYIDRAVAEVESVWMEFGTGLRILITGAGGTGLRGNHVGRLAAPSPTGRGKAAVNRRR